MALPRLCRACSGPLRWIQFEDGRMRPVDPVPTPRTGDVAARPVGGRYTAGYRLSNHRPLRDGFVRFDSHARICRPRRVPPTQKPLPPERTNP